MKKKKTIIIFILAISMNISSLADAGFGDFIDKAKDDVVDNNKSHVLFLIAKLGIQPRVANLMSKNK